MAAMSTKLGRNWITMYANCGGSSADETGENSKRLAQVRWWAEKSREIRIGTFCEDGSVRVKKEKQKIVGGIFGGSKLNKKRKIME